MGDLQEHDLERVPLLQSIPLKKSANSMTEETGLDAQFASTHSTGRRRYDACAASRKSEELNTIGSVLESRQGDTWIRIQRDENE